MNHKGWARVIAAAAAVLAFSGNSRAVAQEACYEYLPSAPVGGPWYATPQAAADGYDAGNSAYTTECTAIASGTSSGWSASCVWTNASTGADAGTYVSEIFRRVGTCAPDPCEELEGDRKWQIISLVDDGPGPNGHGPVYVCDDATDCKMGVIASMCLNGSQCGNTYEHIGEQCSTEQDPLGGAGDSGVGCITDDGTQICVSNDPENCGYLNGEYMCVENVPDGNCIFMNDGGMVCADSAGAPPAPTDETGAPAAPDAVLDAESTSSPGGDTLNYYNSNTVDNSSTTTSGQDNPSGEGEPGSGGSDSGDVVEKLEELTEPTPESVDDPIGPLGDELDTLADGVEDELSDPDDWTPEGTGITQNVQGAFPSGGCSGNLVVTLPALAGQGGGSFAITCGDTAVIRQWVSWVMRVLLLMAIMNMVFSRPPA